MLTVWDAPADPPSASGLVYRWNGYGEAAQVRSLLGYVEVHSDRLRRAYLSWVHDLGETCVRGRRVVDHLALANGLSYWWMTLLVEQSPWKSPSMVDAIRVLALEEILSANPPGSVRLVSSDRRLHAVLSDLCRRLSIGYRWERLPPGGAGVPLVERVYRALPYSVQALVSVTRHLRLRWVLTSLARPPWAAGRRARLFCSYFIHLDREAGDRGVFHSRQWEALPKVLHEAGLRANWLQHFLVSETVPTTGVAMTWATRFNQHPDANGAHAFVDTFLSWRILARALAGWLKLAVMATRLRAIRHAFRPHGSQVSLWPLLRHDWHVSMRGHVAMNNLLWIGLSDRALGQLPRQPAGFYLCENQAWERAFVHAWRTHRHGRLLAVAHATVRYWDLRYFTDPRTVRSTAPHAMPRADGVVLNGQAAIEAFRSVEFPEEAIVEGEALRYGYLGFQPATAAGSRLPRDIVRVLVLGDFDAAATVKMLRALDEAAAGLPFPATFTLKPHPNFTPTASEYPALRLAVVTEGLATILAQFDIAFCSNSTSAAVDAYLAGLPVVVMLDDTTLNVSPVRGRSGVSFVSTPAELVDALVACRGAAAPGSTAERDSFFFLDPALPRWRKLLDLDDGIDMAPESRQGKDPD